jgi:hypothetical protein
MTSARPPLKVCPICHIAMQCEYIDGGVEHVCERCGLTIAVGPGRGAHATMETRTGEEDRTLPSNS